MVPTGIGVLYGKRELLEKLPPYQGGGEMIEEVTRETVSYNHPPHRFEAGTPPIVQAVGLGAALDYIEGIGRARIRKHEEALLRPCAQASVVDQFAAHHRRCGRERPDHLVHDGRRACA